MWGSGVSVQVIPIITLDGHFIGNIINDLRSVPCVESAGAIGSQTVPARTPSFKSTTPKVDHLGGAGSSPSVATGPAAFLQSYFDAPEGVAQSEHTSAPDAGSLSFHGGMNAEKEQDNHA